MLKELTTGAVLCIGTPLLADDAKSFDAAGAFGARPDVMDLSLSPDGQSVLYVKPTHGQGATAYSLGLAKGATPKVALAAAGTPDRIGGCYWVSNERVVCLVYGLVKDPVYGFLPFTRLVAVNADGTNPQLLSTRESNRTHGMQLGGGFLIDELPEQDGAVLMTRVHMRNDTVGTRIGSTKEGMGVDWVDTRSLATKEVEKPRVDAVGYITDGHGTIRVVEIVQGTGKAFYQDDNTRDYMYRPQGSLEWHKLSRYNFSDHSGFRPVAVDRDLNVAYGFKKKDGRMALYSVKLDDSLYETLVYSNPDVDVDSVRMIGRHHHLVGVSYATDYRRAVFFNPQITQLLAALHKALPQQPLVEVVDASLDESRLLIFAGSDSDPGAYYIFDRKSHELQTFLAVRSPLEGVKLAHVKPITYPGPDGVMVPGYLTLPPDAESAKGLPALVLPHGGPSARDEWGFDWLSQYFASRGFAVLQPNFRGSSGYGDAWFQDNGFKDWQIAIGDVLAGGRWLVSQGADPAKLAAFGWSYGGYAVLQSAVVDPSLFKAVVAVAPVTDLAALKEQYRRWTNFEIESAFIGEGAHIRDGSPAEHAEKIKAPVLLFHGGFDRNVHIEQSKLMCSRLTSAGGRCELVTWDDLDHYLDDSSARTQMLRRSNDFLRSALGM